jgi:type I restriction enzyme, S subunit
MQLLQHFKELTVHPKNAEELKGLILQLAVQGKLTAQWRKENPDVEPASVLLEKIAAEKAKLVKEGKIKNEKPLPEIREDENPYYLPKSWNMCRLGDYTYYGSLNKCEKNIIDSDTWVLELEDVEKGSSRLLQKVRLNNRVFKSTKSAFYKSDVIYGKLRPYLDKVIVADENGVCTTEMIPIKSFDESNPEYLKWYLKSPDFIKYANGSTHGMRMPRLGTDAAKKAFISVPPAEEQKAIVTTVNQLFVEVEQLEDLTQQRIQLKEDFVTSALRQLSTTDSISAWAFLQPHFKTFFTGKTAVKKLRESILQLAVQGKLTKHWREQRTLSGTEGENASVLLERIKAEKALRQAQGKIKKEKPLPEITEEEIPYELPEGWVWCRLSEMTELITKGSSPKWQGIHYVEEGEGILFVTSENVGSYELIWKKKKYVESKFNKITPRSILKRNDLLMNIVGGSIGRTAIYNIDELANINQAVTIIRLLPLVSFDYFLHFFNSPTCISYMYDKQVDNARPNLSMGNISKFLIPFPSLEEQKAIVQKVNALMALCDSLEKEIETHQTTQEQWMQSCLNEVLEN